MGQNRLKLIILVPRPKYSWWTGPMLYLLMPSRQTIHYSDVIMGTIASQITSLTIVYSNVYSGADQRKHQSSASLAFVLGIHQWPVNSTHKWPVTRKMFPFDDVIMQQQYIDYVEKIIRYYVITPKLFSACFIAYLRSLTHKGSDNNIPTLIKIVAWCRPG